MDKYVVSQERDKCIGCMACVLVCPNNWFMENDNKASFKKSVLKTPEEIEENQLAEASCPVAIIHVKKESSGKK